jgi:23S rRNA (cytosine1962-C5)-methyltransferase
MPDLFEVALKKDLGRTLRQGHPWIFRDAILNPQRLDSGTLVSVLDKHGHRIAHGFWDAHSTIAVRVLDRHPIESREALIRARLKTALAARLARIDTSKTTAFRWVHGEADRLPGIHVDRYADVATIRYDGEGSRAFYAELPALLAESTGGLPLRRVLDRDARTEAQDEVEILEDGLRFVVDLGRGQKGGLFLDQRENRIALARLSVEKTVLNLFGYTGGFSVHAARAGALHTDTVDLARPAIAAARRNFELNQLDLSRAQFHAVDVFAFLQAATAQARTWDIVISDPPSFAPSKSSLEAARKSYLRLHALAAKVVAPGGLLAAASCSSHVGRKDFLTLVSSGVHQAGRRFVLERYTGAGLDHPTLSVFPEGDYLKFALGRVQ